ncbi:MAG: tau 95 subunit of transcription factor TFIIIC [Vezdaea aestivalis]|nr:MAG: tau 95 subunit of transcription factor TFIIIC [Vezdaea aestivalis]
MAQLFPGKLPPLPWIEIGESGLVSIEHPFIVKNVSKGLDMIGGTSRISEIVHRNQNSQLRLILNPADPATRPIKSTKRDTANLALKLTVPKRTGRKRKRGSDDPWQSYDVKGGPQTFSRNLVRSLEDNHDSYKTECVGVVDHTHRWHDLSDFQISTQDSEIMQRVQDSLIGLDYRKIKEFNLDAEEPTEWTKLVASPAMTHLTMPFNYGYMQNPAVHQTTDQTGKTTLSNTQQPERLLTIRITADAKAPQEMNPKVLPIDEQDPELITAVQNLNKLFDDRPLWTRRAILNKTNIREAILKPAVQYVGYMFTSGPWRDAIIKYGVDPRTDPEMHRYQTLSYQITEAERTAEQPWEDKRAAYLRKSRGQERDRHSHIFDGASLVQDGKIWQVCDITDPLLKGLLETEDLRSTCDTKTDGWYHNGRWAKVKTIMKTKINALLSNKSLTDTDFAQVLALPDVAYNASKNAAHENVRKLRRQTDFGPSSDGRKQTKRPLSQSHVLPKGSRWVKLGIEGPEGQEDDGGKGKAGARVEGVGGDKGTEALAGDEDGESDDAIDDEDND